MNGDLRIHLNDFRRGPGAGGSAARALLLCPECHEPVPLATGLCGNRLIDAVRLQAERIGAELECRRCGIRFLYCRSPLVRDRMLLADMEGVREEETA